MARANDSLAPILMFRAHREKASSPRGERICSKWSDRTFAHTLRPDDSPVYG